MTFKMTQRFQCCVPAGLFFFLFNTFKCQIKSAEFTNRVDLDDVAHDELPHLDLHCLLSGLRTSSTGASY